MNAPTPINASNVEIFDDLMELADCMAENVHDV